MPSERTYETSDLGEASWISMRFPDDGGLELLRAERLPGDSRPGPGRAQGKGRFSFVFKDPDGSGKVLQVRYQSTCCARHDDYVRRLRKMVS